VTLVGIVNATSACTCRISRAGSARFNCSPRWPDAPAGDVEGEVFVQRFTPFHRRFSSRGMISTVFLGGGKSRIAGTTASRRHAPRAHPSSAPRTSSARAFSAETLHRRAEGTRCLRTHAREPAPAPLEKSHGSYRFHLMLAPAPSCV